MFRNRTTIAIAALALALSAASAGAQVTTAPGTAKAGHERHEGKHKADRRVGRKQGGAIHRATLRGVELTDAQKQQLSALRTKFRADAQPIAARMRPAMTEARAARQKGDTTAARAALARTQADRAALEALHARQRTEMLAILTPEQRVKVEANVQQMRERHDGKAKGSKMKRGGRQG